MDLQRRAELASAEGGSGARIKTPEVISREP
jgi:hypothetical protein